jgi:hypothetical protein
LADIEQALPRSANRSRLAIIILSCVVVALTAGVIYTRIHTPSPDAFETVFRHMFEHPHVTEIAAYVREHEIDGFTHHVVVFDDDPGPEFLARFEDCVPSVRGKPDWNDPSVRPGINFWITNCRWVGPNTIKVQGGFQHFGHFQAGATYTVERQGAVWIVTDENQRWEAWE